MAADTRLDVDTQLTPLLETFPEIPLNAETLPSFRAALQQMAQLPEPGAHSGVRVEEVQVPRNDGSGDIRCLLIVPSPGPSRGALLHVHGGGFVMGLPEMDAARNIALAEALGCEILSVEYRLAPEHPHPAGLEDCHQVLDWLAGRAGRDRAPIGLIGESAGGAIAASLALLARDRATVPLACQVLIYPMLCPPGSEAKLTARDQRIGRHVWPRESNTFGWEAYLGGQPGDPRTLAGIAQDLSGLPPAFVAVGELDLFVHDDLAFASRLMAAGTSVEAHCYSGAFHGFDRMAEADVSLRFTRDLLDFLHRNLG